MNYTFRESAVSWLKEKGFEEAEIEELQKTMNMVEKRKSADDPLILLPKNASSRISTLVHLLVSVTDAEGKPVCFDEEGFIDVPEEAQTYFEDDLELQELEGAVSRLQKVKFGRMHSRAKRRGSVKDERY